MKYLMILVKLTLLLTATTVQAQQPAAAPAAATTPPSILECRVLTGRVTDPFDYPLTGAILMLRSPDKGLSSEAFSTNAEGHYLVTARQAIPRNTIMEITAVGYTTLELPLTSCHPLDLTLNPVRTSYKAKPNAKKRLGNGKMH